MNEVNRAARAFEEIKNHPNSAPLEKSRFELLDKYLGEKTSKTSKGQPAAKKEKNKG